MILALLMFLQDYQHPYLASKDLSVVQILEVSEAVVVEREGWPKREYRGTVKVRVEESFVGPKKAGQELTLPTVQYRIHGVSDRPMAAWDGVELNVGLRLILTRETELQVWEAGDTDPADIREILRLKGLPPAELGTALRKMLKDARMTPTLGAASRELIQKHPEIPANAEAIFGFLQRKDVDQVERFLWAGVLGRLPRGAPGVCDVWWRILDRGEPPAGEDPRIILHSVVGLGGYIWALGVTPPKAEDFVPATVSKDRILQALDWAARHDRTQWMENGKRLPEDPSLGKMRRFLGR